MQPQEDRKQHQTSTKGLHQSRSCFKHHFGMRRAGEVFCINSVAVEEATFASNLLTFLTNWKEADLIDCRIQSLSNGVDEEGPEFTQF
jgi:hypothetical protein